MYKRLYMVFLFLSLSLYVYSQQITIDGFFLSESDLAAQGRETSVFDQNGDRCALIRIQTKEKGFVFDVGSAGVQYVDDNRVGEIWVYVPYGVRHISIRHPKYESLVNYNFPINIHKARTYIMNLSIKESFTTNSNKPASQYLIFRFTPPTATVIVNDEAWESNNGSARKYVSMGKYSYRVIAPHHKSKSGEVVLDNPNEKKLVDVQLESEMVNVEFSVPDEAEIWIDGEKVGKGHYITQLGKGKYLVEAKKEGHRTTKREVTIDYEKGDQKVELLAPVPASGALNVSSTPDFSTIFIDGVEVGETPEMLQEVLIGRHSIRIEHARYKTITDSVYIEEGKVANYDKEMSLDDDYVYDVVEQMPTFPGGTSELLQYISSNISYPASERRLGKGGRVFCSFIVEKNGSISDVRVYRGVNDVLDREAVRVIRSMPRWIPGRMKGETVRVKYAVPVDFKIK